jgi:hypothetical protein
MHKMTIKVGSDRNFCIVFSVFFFILSLFQYSAEKKYFYFLLFLSLTMLLIGLLMPNLVTRLNYAWCHFGMLLQRVVSPIVLAIIFYALITPIGILMSIFKQKPINTKWRKPNIKTFWQQKITEKNTELDTFKNQF